MAQHNIHEEVSNYLKPQIGISFQWILRSEIEAIPGTLGIYQCLEASIEVVCVVGGWFRAMGKPQRADSCYFGPESAESIKLI
jgi:hypothetical protein